MLVNRWNPWNEMFSGQEQLFIDALGRPLVQERPFHTLPLDIRQSDDAFELEASVPGFDPQDVEITFDENVLTIRGTRRDDDATRGTYVRRERNAHSVYRQVSLPAEVKVEAITARFDNGVLTVTIPRAQRAQPTRIPVLTTVEHAKRIDADAHTKLPVSV